jgi:hypothetical protein
VFGIAIGFGQGNYCSENISRSGSLASVSVNYFFEHGMAFFMVLDLERGNQRIHICLWGCIDDGLRIDLAGMEPGWNVSLSTNRILHRP